MAVTQYKQSLRDLPKTNFAPKTYMGTTHAWKRSSASYSDRATARLATKVKTSMWRYRLDGAKILQDDAGRWHVVHEGWSHGMFDDVARAIDWLGCVDRDARNALYARYGRKIRQITQLPFAKFFKSSTGSYTKPATFC